jgi:hypothetical protein
MRLLFVIIVIIFSVNSLYTQNVYYGLYLNTKGNPIEDNREINIKTNNSGTDLFISKDDAIFLHYFVYNFGIAKLKNYKHHFFYVFLPSVTYSNASFSTDSNALGYDVFDIQYWNFNTSLRIGNHLYKGQVGQAFAYTFYLSVGFNVNFKSFAIKETAANSFVEENPHKLNDEFQDIIYPTSCTYDYFIDIGMCFDNMYFSFIYSLGHSESELIFQKYWGISTGIFFNPFKKYNKYKIYTD